MVEDLKSIKDKLKFYKKVLKILKKYNNRWCFFDDKIEKIEKDIKSLKWQIKNYGKPQIYIMKVSNE